MRVIITGSSLFLVLVISVLIHCSIVGMNIRDTEISMGLDDAMDYGIDIMGDIYGSLDFDTANESEYKNTLMQAFCNAVSERTGTDGELSVSMIYADSECINIIIEERYEYPVKGKYGVCYCEKTVRMK